MRYNHATMRGGARNSITGDRYQVNFLSDLRAADAKST